MRNNMITTLAEDYVRMGRAKGLSEPARSCTATPARNAFLPNLSGFAMSLGFVISGAILVEYVFNYPGLGYMLYNAVQNTDYPLHAGAVPAVHRGRAGRGPLCDFAIACSTRGPGAKGVADDRDCWSAPATPDRDAPARRRRRRAAGPRSGATARPWSALALLPRLRPCWPPFPQLFTSVHGDPDALGVRARPGAPSGEHLLGTTALGQDIFAQLVYGTRQSLVIALVAGLFATVLSVIIGVSAAYLGGLADDALSMLTDVFLVLPTFPLIIVLATYAGKGNLTGDHRRADRDRLVVRRAASCARRRCRCATGTSSSRPGSAASGRRTSSCSRCCRR